MINDPMLGLIVLHHVDPQDHRDFGCSHKISLTVMDLRSSVVLLDAMSLDRIVTVIFCNVTVATVIAAVSQEWSMKSPAEVCR